MDDCSDPGNESGVLRPLLCTPTKGRALLRSASHLGAKGYLDICRDDDRRGRPRRKLPRCRPLGLGPQRRHRGTCTKASSVDSIAVSRHALRLCRRRSPRPCTSLIAPRRSLRQSETKRFRSFEALVTKPLFTNDQWGPPLNKMSFDLTKWQYLRLCSHSFQQTMSWR